MNAKSNVESELLDRSEIQRRYAPHWVLLVDTEQDKAGSVVRGRVVFHSPNRREVHAKSVALGLQSAAILFLGPKPKNLEYAL